MRYRLLASYQGAPYEAGIGPDEAGVVLFAACPPPEDLRFEPATGHWRKEVSRTDVQMLYESRPVGKFRGERCVVLDDLNDRLHIAYLGHDAYRAEQLGYWEVDRGVFELITPRQEVTDIVEQRLPLALSGDGDPRSAPASDPSGHAVGYGPQPANGIGPGTPVAPAGPGAGQSGLISTQGQSRVSIPAVDEPPLPLEAEAMRAATAAARRGKKNQPKHGAAITPAGAAAPPAGSAGSPAGPAGGLAEPVPEPAPAAALMPVTPAGLSEPSGAVNHGDSTSAVPSWTPQSHVPPQRQAQASVAAHVTPVQATPSAQATAASKAMPEAPAGSQTQSAEHVQPAEQVPPAEHVQPAEEVQPAEHVQPTEHVQPAPHAQPVPVIENVPIHGAPLPMPAEAVRPSAVSPPARHPAQGPGSAGQMGSGQPSVPPGDEAVEPEPGGMVNGVAHDGRAAARAQFEFAHPATYMLDQLELPRPTAGATPSAQVGSSPGTPDQLRRDERPLGAEAALTATPPAGADIEAIPIHGRATATTTVPVPAPAQPEPQPTPRRRRASRRRLPTQRIFSELAAQAGILASAYAIGEDVDGAMCLVSTDDGFEVFNSLAGSRHEVRAFEDEESAYFYLFGVLAAEAVRTGVLAPRHRAPG
jgi:hypothetical protein